MKAQARVIAIDDGHFSKDGSRAVPLIGVVSRLGGYIEGVTTTSVEVDGSDSTDKITTMVNSTRFKPQLHCVMLHGFTFAGFNIVDLGKLAASIKLPVIAILRSRPDEKEVEKALHNLADFRQKLLLFRAAGKPLKHKSIYFYARGIEEHDVRALIDATTVRGNIPEPLRLAHIIASGITKGESSGF